MSRHEMTIDELAAVREKLEIAIGALADIAFAKDMDLRAVQRKAKRIYEELRAEELAAERGAEQTAT